MADKKIVGTIGLQVKAGEANPSPPIGPALGQHGLNIMDFCKQFNDRRKSFEKGTLLPVDISVYADRTFSFVVKTPPASFLLKKEAGIEKGSGVPNKDKVGTVTREQLAKIAETKMPDLNAATLDQAIKSIAGTARSMGIKVEEKTGEGQ